MKKKYNEDNVNSVKKHTNLDILNNISTNNKYFLKKKEND